MVAIEEAIRRGRACAAGAAGRPDLVAAHQWFNVAAIAGSGLAAELRRSTAAEMTKGELSIALRRARRTLCAGVETCHPSQRRSRPTASETSASLAA